MKSFNALHDYDFICLSETFLSSSVSSTLDSPNIDGYNIVRSDHLSGSKRGGMCYYVKENLPVKCMTTNRFQVPLFWHCFLSLALNIYSFFSLRLPTPSRLFHSSVWESSEICAFAVFSCLFFGYLFVKYFSFVFFLVQL